MRQLRETIDESKLGPDSPLRALLKQKRRAPSRDLEHAAQVAVFEWARAHEAEYPELEWLFAVPNFSGRQGKRTARQGHRLNAEGRKRGVPDMLFPVRRGVYVGLAIELKAGRNTTTPEQERWLAHLRASGWFVSVAHSTEQVIELLTVYLTTAA